MNPFLPFAFHFFLISTFFHLFAINYVWTCQLDANFMQILPSIVSPSDLTILYYKYLPSSHFFLPLLNFLLETAPIFLHFVYLWICSYFYIVQFINYTLHHVMSPNQQRKVFNFGPLIYIRKLTSPTSPNLRCTMYRFLFGSPTLLDLAQIYAYFIFNICLS